MTIRKSIALHIFFMIVNLSLLFAILAQAPRTRELIRTTHQLDEDMLAMKQQCAERSLHTVHYNPGQ